MTKSLFYSERITEIRTWIMTSA